MSATILAENTATTKEYLVTLVRKWGDVNTDGLLEEGCLSFIDSSIEGFIGYRLENRHAIVFGDPVCAEENKALLAKAFLDQCHQKNIKVVYTIASSSFANWALENQRATIIEFGEKFILDPFLNPVEKTGPRAVLVRKKVKHAIKEGISIHEYLGDDPQIEQKINDVATAWVKKRKGPQVYLAHVTLFNDRFGKRWFYAEKEGQIIGLLVLNEIQSQKGWLLNNVMMIPHAPNGLSEFLIVSALQTLEKEGCHHVLAGPVTAKKLGQISGVNKGLELAARGAFQCAKMIFHLDGYESYWLKFDPKIEGSYLIFIENNLGYSSVKALLSAYNVGSH